MCLREYACTGSSEVRGQRSGSAVSQLVGIQQCRQSESQVAHCSLHNDSMKSGGERQTLYGCTREERESREHTGEMPGSRDAAGSGGCGAMMVWGVLVLVAGWGSVEACPTPCSCLGNTVDCHGLGIHSIPRNIPRGTERL
ncbi:hypothetical protein NQZ68_013503 [Dissostichus eleginoides]|nr:hypothetical protein NQZ68_013503 [Dissostichus eleginoides]